VHASDNAEALYAASLESGFEGIVAKRRDGHYLPGRRSSVWLKVKAINTSEFVIGGYTQGKGARSTLGAVLLGYWDDGNLRYVGHADRVSMTAARGTVRAIIEAAHAQMPVRKDAARGIGRRPGSSRSSSRK
jgi:bifunctional non-homologous end joining protein LigD